MINLLEELQDEFGLTYIFIAHDLGVVRHVSDRIAVMYLGKLVELSPAEELYSRPIMPYTEALLSAVPIPDPDLSRSASGSCSRATCPRRSTHRPDAASTPAAATRRTSASRSSRRSRTTATATSPPATTRSMWTRRRSSASALRRRHTPEDSADAKRAAEDPAAKAPRAAPIPEKG